MGATNTSVGALFERFFPGREDVIRLLMEPITYANGSTLEDPAISYGIVFSNFMSKGVFTFQGGTDRLIGLMRAEMVRNGVDLRIRAEVQGIYVRGGRVEGVTVNGRFIRARAVVSNANLKSTIFRLIMREEQPDAPIENHFLEEDDPGALVSVAGAAVLASSDQSEDAERFVLGSGGVDDRDRAAVRRAGSPHR